MNKKEFLDNYIVDRKNTHSYKWDQLEEKYGRDDLIAMWIADTEFKIPKKAREMMIDRINHGAFGYTEVSDKYYKAVEDWMKNYGLNFKKDWLRFSTGCITALAWAINAFTKVDDTCAIFTPVYYPFYNVVTNNNRKLAQVPLDYNEGNFTINFEKFEQIVKDENVKMLLWCSPHNPSGRVFSEEELDRVFAICEKYDLIIASDEIHQDLALFDNKFIPALAVNNGKYQDRIIAISSASKTFNMASLLHSHIMIADEKLRKIFDDYASGINRTENNALGLTATYACYKYGKEWKDNLIQVIEDNYLYIKNELESLNKGIKVCPLEGTYLLFIDFTKAIDKENIHDFIVNKCKIAPDFGEVFGKGYEGFIRLNIATDPKFVKKAISNIKENL